MTKLAGHLQIIGLELYINLGWRDKEQLEPQAIMLDIDILFSEPPKAVNTDHLEDTICYAALIEKIRSKTGNKKYRLIEHLSHEIAQTIEPELPENARYHIKITKKPKIVGLNGGVSYSYFQKLRD